MADDLSDYIPKISVTGLKAVLFDTFVFWKSTTEVDTTDLQESIENQSRPTIKSRGKHIDSNQNQANGIDFITIQLENLGQGVAQNLYVRPTLVVSYDPDPGKGTPIDIEDACFITSRGEGFEIRPRYFRLSRTEGDYFENSSRDGGVLSQNEGRVEFRAQVEFEEVFHGEGGREAGLQSTIFETTQRLYEAGIRYISFRVDVLYTDVNENVYTEQVIGKLGQLTGGITLSEINDFRYSSEGSDHTLRRRIDETYKYPHN